MADYRFDSTGQGVELYVDRQRTSFSVDGQPFRSLSLDDIGKNVVLDTPLVAGGQDTGVSYADVFRQTVTAQPAFEATLAQMAYGEKEHPFVTALAHVAPQMYQLRASEGQWVVRRKTNGNTRNVPVVVDDEAIEGISHDTLAQHIDDPVHVEYSVKKQTADGTVDEVTIGSLGVSYRVLAEEALKVPAIQNAAGIHSSPYHSLKKIVGGTEEAQPADVGGYVRRLWGGRTMREKVLVGAVAGLAALYGAVHVLPGSGSSYQEPTPVEERLPVLLDQARKNSDASEGFQNLVVRAVDEFIEQNDGPDEDNVPDDLTPQQMEQFKQLEQIVSPWRQRLNRKTASQGE